MSEQDIDVYERYQGKINWPQVKAAGIGGVWIKMANGAGKIVGSYAPDEYANGARAAGLKIGGYGYVLGSSSPENQAETLGGEVNRLNAFGKPPMCDFEDASLPTGAADRRAWLTRYFGHLKSVVPNLATAFMYSSGSWLAEYAAGGWTPSVNGLRVVTIDAEYGANNGIEHTRTHYTVPVAAHQYTSAGHVPGVSGDVDRDTDYSDYPVLTTDQENTDMAAVDDQSDSYRDLCFDALTVRSFSDTVPGGPQNGQPNGLKAYLVAQFTNQANTLAAIDQHRGTDTTALTNLINTVDAHRAADSAADASTFTALSTALQSLSDADATKFASVIGAVQAIQGSSAVGNVDVNALASALAPALTPLLPAVDPQVLADAVRTVFAAHLGGS